MRRAIETRSNPPRTFGPVAVALALTAIATAASGLVYAADTVQVSQRNRMFNPDNLQLDRGSVVRIVNDDRVTHHIYVDSPGMSFDSGEQPIGHTVDLRFDKAGAFEVLCAIHPTMRLKVTVK
jgi:plastocyanin